MKIWLALKIKREIAQGRGQLIDHVAKQFFLQHARGARERTQTTGALGATQVARRGRFEREADGQALDGRLPGKGRGMKAGIDARHIQGPAERAFRHHIYAIAEINLHASR